MIRTLVALAGAGTLLAAQPTLAQEPAESSIEVSQAELALAQRIIDLGFPEAEREQLFFGTADQMSSQMREAMLKSIPINDPGALAVLDAWVEDYLADGKVILKAHIPRLMDAMVRAYAGTFTEQELSDILVFVSTPSGASFFRKSSNILSEPEFAAANQAYMDEVMAGFPDARNELRNRIQQYVKDKAATDRQVTG